ncbi:hypothetical protein TNCV_4290681 [Trichonephila clavipes]|nr:hypothetical protein TNCV_4290681 [Trichonephila clavipes]
MLPLRILVTLKTQCIEETLMPVNSFETQCLPVCMEAAVAKWLRYRIVAGLVTSSSPVPLKTCRSPYLEMRFGTSHQMRDGIWKWEIVSPDDPDQDNRTELLNYCIVIGPGQVSKISN